MRGKGHDHETEHINRKTGAAAGVDRLDDLDLFHPQPSGFPRCLSGRYAGRQPRLERVRDQDRAGENRTRHPRYTGEDYELSGESYDAVRRSRVMAEEEFYQKEAKLRLTYVGCGIKLFLGGQLFYSDFQTSLERSFCGCFVSRIKRLYWRHFDERTV